MANIKDYASPGDIVVGQYRESGGMIKQATTVDEPAEVQRRAEMIRENAIRSGGKPLRIGFDVIPKASVKPKGRKPKAKEKQEAPAPTVQFFTPEPLLETYNVKEPTKKTVYLHNDFGKIKLQVTAVLDSELAFCLVFANEDDIVLEPKAGETLKFTNTDRETHDVFFTGTLFTWVDGVQKLMVLFRKE